jgi:predicted DNA-binding transcriptional regulator AlpA
LKLQLCFIERRDSMMWTQNSVKSEFCRPSTPGPAGRAGVGADLTEYRIRPNISTLAGPHRPGYPTIGGNQAMGSALMVQEVETVDPLLTAEDVALKLKVSKDWVWDHSSRRLPYLPVIRMSDGALRYRASGIEEFLKERERASCLRRKRR